MLGGNVIGRFDPLLNGISGPPCSAADFPVSALVTKLRTSHLSNHAHGDCLFIPAERIGKTVDSCASDDLELELSVSVD